MKPPIAPRIDHAVTVHGVTLEDPYHWLKDSAYPEVNDARVLDYLQAENAYFDHFMAPHQSVVDSLFEEIKSRQPSEDESVPYRKDNYWYRWRFEKDAQYRLYLRAPVTDADNWTVFLDEPALAAAHEYFTLGGLSISPDGRYLAWSADTNGSERYNLSITDLQTDALCDQVIEQTLSSPVWSADGEYLFYLRLNDAWRPYQVCRHRLGTQTSEDVVMFEETDESFFVGIDQTQSDAYILISSGDHVTSETHVLRAQDPTQPPLLICPRRTGHEYDVDHREGYFYIRSNDTHKNFRIVRAPEAQPQPENWQLVVEGDDSHYLTGHFCFKDYLLVSERIDGIDNIRIIHSEGESGADNDESGTEFHGDDHTIKFPEEVYSADFGTNAEYDCQILRLAYESMTTPATVYDYDIRKRELLSRKVQQIPTGYQADDYQTHRLHVRSRDGVTIPVSIVYRKGLHIDGTAPLYLYGYGAYGLSEPPGFSSTRLSLLDRGFVFAIAHIRGGDDLGYQWYEDGKLDKRTNTFNDFVDVARDLIAQRYSSAGLIAIAGGSAGGELMGACVNQAPELFGAVIAHVPFVDVLNTMLDDSLPLTPMEWPEWGNPIVDKQAFELIRSYSPYDQLQARDYPPMLVTAGLNDPRVTYWEPAKYVAKLRHLKTDNNPLLLKTNMGAGHSGRSGRFDSLKEVAEEYAFILIALGLLN